MKTRIVLRTAWPLLVLAALFLLPGNPVFAQTSQTVIHQILEAIINDRIPRMQNPVLWLYGKPASWEFIPIQASGTNACPGEALKFYTQDRDYWGYASIQDCGSDNMAESYASTVIPDLASSFNINAKITSEWQGKIMYAEGNFLASRGAELEDYFTATCVGPYKEKLDSDIQANCGQIGCENIIVGDPYNGGTHTWVDCSAVGNCEAPYYSQYHEAVKANCPGANYWSTNASIWKMGNYILTAAEDPATTLELSWILEGCGDCRSLAALLAEESYKRVSDLKQASQPAQQTGQQPNPAEGDQDNDGINDAIDLCKQQYAPENPDGCPTFSVQLGCGPDYPAVDEEVVCQAQAQGIPDGTTADYQWWVDGVYQDNQNPFAWTATAGPHQISVMASIASPPKTATGSWSVSVGGAAPPPVVDDTSAGFAINFLSCGGTDDITSDDTLACTVGFERLDPDIEELTVVWLVDGMKVLTQTRRDDISQYSLDKPAPGVHDVQVQVTDPRTGKTRVMSTTAIVMPGKNAMVPPGSAAGAAVVTTGAVGLWLWGQWFLARRRGWATLDTPVGKLPAGAGKLIIHSGKDAEKILDDLKMLNELKKLLKDYKRGPGWLAKRDEILDTFYDSTRRVRGINFTTRIDEKTGDEVINEDSIVIVVDETPPPKFLDEPPPPPKKKEPPPEKTKPPQKIKDPIKDWEKELDDLKKERDNLERDLNHLQQEKAKWKINHDNLNNSVATNTLNDLFWACLALVLTDRGLRLKVPGGKDFVKWLFRGKYIGAQNTVTSMINHTAADAAKRAVKQFSDYLMNPSEENYRRLLNILMDPITIPIDTVIKDVGEGGGGFGWAFVHIFATPKSWLKGAFVDIIAKLKDSAAGGYANAAFQAASGFENAYREFCVSKKKWELVLDLNEKINKRQTRINSIEAEIARLENWIKLQRKPEIFTRE